VKEELQRELNRLEKDRDFMQMKKLALEEKKVSSKVKGP
jgi:hypothetical protein